MKVIECPASAIVQRFTFMYGSEAIHVPALSWLGAGPALAFVIPFAHHSVDWPSVKSKS